MAELIGVQFKHVGVIAFGDLQLRIAVLPNRSSRPIPPDPELAIVVIQGQRYWIAA